MDIVSLGGVDVVRDSNWHNLVVTWDSNKLSFYDNGLLIGEGFKTAEVYPQINRLDIGVANADHTDGYGSFAKGTIDDVLIFNRALSEAEIQAIYNDGNWPPGPATSSWAETTAFTNDVQYSKINTDGTLGSWVSTEPVILGGMQSIAVHDRFLYSTGGHDGTNYVNKSYFTEFLP